MNTQEHWDKFAEFCKYEMLSGGPDPQIPLVAEMSKEELWPERLWRAGCYIAVYNVPFAEVIWNHWSYFDVQGTGILEMRQWLTENWNKLATRVERKTVRRPDWMFEYFQSYYNFLNRGILDQALSHCKDMSPQERYVYLWDLTISNIKRYGRYVALKLLESYDAFCDIKVKAPDIRPKDGWSPREALAMLFPNVAIQLNTKDGRFDDLVNATVDRAIQKLNFDYGITVNYFQIQVMLCEYRESYEGKKQYPGRSLDSELGYWMKMRDKWSAPERSHQMFLARKALFPEKHLGELNGWYAPRKACGSVLADYNYTWSDLLYNYNESQLNMAEPVKWED